MCRIVRALSGSTITIAEFLAHLVNKAMAKRTKESAQFMDDLNLALASIHALVCCVVATGSLIADSVITYQGLGVLRAAKGSKRRLASGIGRCFVCRTVLARTHILGAGVGEVGGRRVDRRMRG